MVILQILLRLVTLWSNLNIKNKLNAFNLINCSFYQGILATENYGLKMLMKSDKFYYSSSIWNLSI